MGSSSSIALSLGRLCARRGQKTRMKFEYTGRHVEVTQAIRSHVEEQFRKLNHIFVNGTEPRVHVILEVEKNRQIGATTRSRRPIPTPTCTWP
jgi:hypothetical protein